MNMMVKNKNCGVVNILGEIQVEPRAGEETESRERDDHKDLQWKTLPKIMKIASRRRGKRMQQETGTSSYVLATRTEEQHEKWKCVRLLKKRLKRITRIDRLRVPEIKMKMSTVTMHTCWGRRAVEEEATNPAESRCKTSSRSRVARRRSAALLQL